MTDRMPADVQAPDTCAGARDSRVLMPGAPRRTVIASLAAVAGMMAVPGVGVAQSATWPGGKTLRLVIPSGAGSGSDIFTRNMAEFLAKDLGTTVIVENKPGATGMLAGEAVARAPADGLTLLVSFSGAIIGNKLMMDKPSFDPIDDLTPIGRIGLVGNVLMVTPDVPAKSVKELADYAKARGETISYGTWGVASGGHLAMESVAQQTGMKTHHVPYKSVGQVPLDMLAGAVKVGWTDAATALPYVQSGRLRAIAVTGFVRLPQMTEVASLKEQGLVFDAPPAYGLFGPKGMSPELAERINAALNRWLAHPQTVEFLATRQNMPRSDLTTPAQYARYLQQELVSWRKLMEQAGVKVK